MQPLSPAPSFPPDKETRDAHTSEASFFFHCRIVLIIALRVQAPLSLVAPLPMNNVTFGSFFEDSSPSSLGRLIPDLRRIQEKAEIMCVIPPTRFQHIMEVFLTVDPLVNGIEERVNRALKHGLQVALGDKMIELAESVVQEINRKWVRGEGPKVVRDHFLFGLVPRLLRKVPAEDMRPGDMVDVKPWVPDPGEYGIVYIRMPGEAPTFRVLMHDDRGAQMGNRRMGQLRLLSPEEARVDVFRQPRVVRTTRGVFVDLQTPIDDNLEELLRRAVEITAQLDRVNAERANPRIALRLRTQEGSLYGSGTAGGRGGRREGMEVEDSMRHDAAAGLGRDADGLNELERKLRARQERVMLAEEELRFKMEGAPTQGSDEQRRKWLRDQQEFRTTMRWLPPNAEVANAPLPEHPQQRREALQELHSACMALLHEPDEQQGSAKGRVKTTVEEVDRSIKRHDLALMLREAVEGFFAQAFHDVFGRKLMQTFCMYMLVDRASSLPAEVTDPSGADELATYRRLGGRGGRGTHKLMRQNDAFARSVFQISGDVDTEDEEEGLEDRGKQKKKKKKKGGSKDLLTSAEVRTVRAQPVTARQFRELQKLLDGSTPEDDLAARGFHIYQGEGGTRAQMRLSASDLRFLHASTRVHVRLVGNTPISPEALERLRAWGVVTPDAFARLCSQKWGLAMHDLRDGADIFRTWQGIPTADEIRMRERARGLMEEAGMVVDQPPPQGKQRGAAAKGANAARGGGENMDLAAVASQQEEGIQRKADKYETGDDGGEREEKGGSRSSGPQEPGRRQGRKKEGKKDRQQGKRLREESGEDEGASGTEKDGGRRREEQKKRERKEGTKRERSEKSGSSSEDEESSGAEREELRRLAEKKKRRRKRKERRKRERSDEGSSNRSRRRERRQRRREERRGKREREGSSEEEPAPTKEDREHKKKKRRKKREGSVESGRSGSSSSIESESEDEERARRKRKGRKSGSKK